MIILHNYQIRIAQVFVIVMFYFYLLTVYLSLFLSVRLDFPPLLVQ